MYPKESDREYTLYAACNWVTEKRAHQVNMCWVSGKQILGPDVAVLQVRVAVSVPIEEVTEQMLRGAAISSALPQTIPFLVSVKALFTSTSVSAIG